MASDIQPIVRRHAPGHRVPRRPQVQGDKLCAETGQALCYAALDNRVEETRKKAANALRDAGETEVAAKIRRSQFRDLRAKAGTDKANATDMREAQQQLGRKSVKTTEIYLGRREGHADQVIHRIAERRRFCGT
jgi:integrase